MSREEFGPLHADSSLSLLSRPGPTLAEGPSSYSTTFLVCTSQSISPPTLTCCLLFQFSDGSFYTDIFAAGAPFASPRLVLRSIVKSLQACVSPACSSLVPLWTAGKRQEDSSVFMDAGKLTSAKSSSSIHSLSLSLFLFCDFMGWNQTYFNPAQIQGKPNKFFKQLWGSPFSAWDLILSRKKRKLSKHF